MWQNLSLMLVEYLASLDVVNKTICLKSLKTLCLFFSSWSWEAWEKMKLHIKLLIKLRGPKSTVHQELVLSKNNKELVLKYVQVVEMLTFHSLATSLLLFHQLRLCRSHLCVCIHTYIDTIFLSPEVFFEN